MALFHFHVTQIKRSTGSSAIASAAYRAGERLYSERYGEVNDYTKKGGIICTGILLPPHAPDAFSDRQTLWNSVEAVEKRADAQLAYSFDITLQNEFSEEENIELALKFIKDNFVAKGMIADYAIHNPDRNPNMPPNPHVHVMCPIRPINEDGSWGAKQKQELVLDANGEPIWDEKHKRNKFNAVPTTDWRSPEVLEEWRANWARLCNEKFEEKGLEVRIDHRSYERQGIDQIPQIHEGPTVRALEAKGIPTEKGEFNRFVRATNEVLKSIRNKISELISWILELQEEIGKQEDKSPSVRLLLMDYMELMKVGAMSFSRYARNKASVTTLKDVANAVNYLENHKIDTLDQLENRLNEISDTVDTLISSMRVKSDRMKLLKDAISQYKIYKENLPVFLEMNQPKYRFKKAKEAYKEAHEGQLKLFYRARRILKEAGLEEPFDAKQIKNLQKELNQLEVDYAKEYDMLRPLREEKNQLQHIRYCVDRVISASDSSRETRDIHKSQQESL